MSSDMDNAGMNNAIMDNAGMKARLTGLAEKVGKWLAGHKTANGGHVVPQRLGDSMHYSLAAGGKRIRPVLCLTTASLCGLEEDTALPFAAAIEMIHTYSLIHDDLPAMDDDDLRRGKPSNHKAFDEATAILAGDGLLTDAFALACTTRLPAETVLAAIRELALAAGSAGMVGGQEWDMIYTGRSGIGLAELKAMHAMKTGALLRASCVCGAILAGAGPERLAAIAAYGEALGVAFQIADDILDLVGDEKSLGKPVGSDLEKGKNTYPALVGLEKSRQLAREQADAAIVTLAGIDGEQAAFLRAIASYTVNRAV